MTAPNARHVERRPPAGRPAGRSRAWPVIGVLLATGPSCSLAFDATALTGGEGATSTAAGGGGGPPSTTTAGTTSSTAAGDGGAGPSTSTGDGGGGAGSTTGGSTSSQGGGGAGGGPCSGPTYCETEGADADLCFDFDGPDPLEGLQQAAPQGDGFTTSITATDAPTLSCPGAALLSIEGESFSPLSVTLGVDLVPGQDHFVLGLAVHRLAIENPAVVTSVAVLKWYVGTTRCEAFLQMRDEAGQGYLSLYTQGNDGGGWVGTGSAYLTLAEPTIGTWTRAELEVALEATSAMAIRADGLEDVTNIAAPCGPTTDHYDVDLGHHYTDRAQITAYDDVTIRLAP